MSKGKFITFEGIEGVGKSTNMRAFASTVEATGRRILCTREPGGTPQAEHIRQMVSEQSDEPMSDIAELLLIFAARSLHVENVIRPAIESGTWVLCDRFTDSSRAYQGAGRGIPMEQVNQLADWVHADLWPDMTILLDAPVEVGMGRASRRSDPDRFEAEKADFFARVRDCYLELACEEPNRFTVIDASRKLTAVTADVERAAATLLDDI